MKKHRNDVARLLQLLSAEATFDLPEKIKADMQSFIDALAGQDDFMPKQFGVAMTREVVIDRLRHAYNL